MKNPHAICKSRWSPRLSLLQCSECYFCKFTRRSITNTKRKTATLFLSELALLQLSLTDKHAFLGGPPLTLLQGDVHKHFRILCLAFTFLCFLFKLTDSHTPNSSRGHRRWTVCVSGTISSLSWATDSRLK